MEVNEKQIDKVLKYYNELKIRDANLENKLGKNIMFGKLWGYEEVLKILGILK